MRKISLMLTFAIVALFGGQLMAQGIEFDTKSSWEELLKISKDKNKLIFLDCYTTWCGPCKGMAAKVFTDSEVGEFMNSNFICTKRDMEQGEGIELQKKYKEYIPGFPTYLLINHKGEVVYQSAGYMEPTKFINSMTQGLEQKSWVLYKERFDKGEHSWPFLREYLEMLEGAFQKNLIDEATSYVKEVLTTDDITGNADAYHLFRTYWKDVNSPVFRYFLSNLSQFRKYDEQEVILNQWAGKLFEAKVREMERSLMEEGNSLAPFNLENSKELIEVLMKSYTLQREVLIAKLKILNSLAEGEKELFFELVESAQQFGLLRNYDSDLSSMCRKFYADVKNKKQLAKCLEITKVDLNSKWLSYRAVRNMAYFIEKAGNKKEAQELYQKAYELEEKMRKEFPMFFK